MLFCSAMPTNNLSFAQQNNKAVLLNHTNEKLPKVDEMAKSKSFKELVNFDYISTISSVDSASVSRSMGESRREVPQVDQTTQSTPAPAPAATAVVETVASPVQEAAPPTVVSRPVDGRSIIQNVALSKGCTQSEVSSLLKIAEQESHFDIDAVNSNSNCVGLFQLDSNKGTFNQRVDPYWNTSKAIEYMKARYGSISAAYSFRENHNWY